MKILYVLPFVPWPIRVRSFNLIPRLARRHEISVICISTNRDNGGIRNPVPDSVRLSSTQLGVGRGLLQCIAALPTPIPLRMAYCYSQFGRRMVQQAIQEVRPDIIYVERWRALPFLPPRVDIPIVCDPTDSMILYNERLLRAGAWWERVVGLEEYLKFLRYEPLLANRVNVTVFCSQIDLERVRKRAPHARFAVIPNGVDCEQFFLKSPEEEDENTIVFTGNFGYRPNRHAIQVFVDKIWPQILHAVPRARFVAVGSGATRYFSNLARTTAGFEVVDFVEQLRPYVAKAAVTVAPMTVGSGVSNKLLEAFATGTPVVSTSIACGDLPVVDREHLLIANESSAFAEKVISLLRSAQLRRRLAENARKLVETRYDWEVVYRKLEELMLDVAH